MHDNNNANDQKRLEILLKQNMEQIDNKILVLSNKGGVGKSSIAVNLAFSLSQKKLKVGLLDADIHGPSIAKLLGFEGKKLAFENNTIIPYQVNENLVTISMASLLETVDTPVVWRGPLKMGVLKQFLAEVHWGKLDYLIIDSPPGTGDEPLSICQLIKDLTGAVIVTTPQDVALLDSRKCVSFLRQLSVPILGILENMSGFICPHCHQRTDLFKSGGGEKASRELNIPFLGKLPFDPLIVETTDNGKPFVEAYPYSEASKIMDSIVQSIIEGKNERKK